MRFATSINMNLRSISPTKAGTISSNVMPESLSSCVKLKRETGQAKHNFNVQAMNFESLPQNWARVLAYSRKKLFPCVFEERRASLPKYWCHSLSARVQQLAAKLAT